MIQGEFHLPISGDHQVEVAGGEVVDGDLIVVQIFLHIIIQAAHLLIAQVGHRIKLAVSKGDIVPSRLRARSG